MFDSLETKVQEFVQAAQAYFERDNYKPEIDGGTVKFGVVIGDNGYDVSLWCEPETARYRCRCVIRNVFPKTARDAVVTRLNQLRQQQGQVGGNIGVNRMSGDLAWTTFCQAPNAILDAPFFDQLINISVRTFDEMVQDVRTLVAQHETEGDDEMNWN